MTTAVSDHAFDNMDEQTYQRRIRAWTLYDWGNSAFATTILAAVLPSYYSSVAGATLPSEATATAYWSLGLSLSLFLVAIMSPVLGTISDVMRGKKRFLSIFAGLGIIGTGLLVLVGTGDWLMASIFFVLGRIGFTGANVFYDALLPHVAREEDHDIVSTRGFAMGYLGGGLLLAINVAMIFFIPDSLFEFAGIRLSFLSVAIWWLIFTIPLLRTVPEPPSVTETLKPGETVVGVSFKRLWATLKDISKYSELFKYLIAFLIYNDAIGTIIGVAVIYGAELGFGTIELLLALLLVQFAGIPFSLIFGRLPSRKDTRRHIYLAFILFNLIALPLVGVLGGRALPIEISGASPEPYSETAGDDMTYFGQGVYMLDSEADDETIFLLTDSVTTDESWAEAVVSGDELSGDNPIAFLTGTPADATYIASGTPGARIDFPVNGASLTLTYSIGPDHGIWAVLVNGEPLTETVKDDDGNEVQQPVIIDAYNETIRYGVTADLELPEAGTYLVSLVTQDEANPDSTGTQMALSQIEVARPARANQLPVIIGIVLAIQIVGLIFAFAFKGMFVGLSNTLDTRRSILLALLIYAVIAVWGYFVDSTLEFWLLAWMVAIVQGGSQALSRSLFASMSPASKSGEFFGLYGVMEKFSAILGPLVFAAAVAIFGTSRPAIVSLVLFFIIGGYLLTRVDIAEGIRVAREEDTAVYGRGTASAET